MSWKQTFLWGIAASLLSSLASMVYLTIYNASFMVDFGRITGPSSIVAACTLGCFLMATGYKLAIGWKGKIVIGWLNLVYSVVSFASIAGVLGFNLPLDIEFPELFPGLVIPMHFFPVLVMLSLMPFVPIAHNKL